MKTKSGDSSATGILRPCGNIDAQSGTRARWRAPVSHRLIPSLEKFHEENTDGPEGTGPSTARAVLCGFYAELGFRLCFAMNASNAGSMFWKLQSRGNFHSECLSLLGILQNGPLAAGDFISGEQSRSEPDDWTVRALDIPEQGFRWKPGKAADFLAQQTTPDGSHGQAAAGCNTAPGLLQLRAPRLRPRQKISVRHSRLNCFCATPRATSALYSRCATSSSVSIPTIRRTIVSLLGL